MATISKATVVFVFLLLVAAVNAADLKKKEGKKACADLATNQAFPPKKDPFTPWFQEYCLKMVANVSGARNAEELEKLAVADLAAESGKEYEKLEEELRGMKKEGAETECMKSCMSSIQDIGKKVKELGSDRTALRTYLAVLNNDNLCCHNKCRPDDRFQFTDLIGVEKSTAVALGFMDALLNELSA